MDATLADYETVQIVMINLPNGNTKISKKLAFLKKVLEEARSVEIEIRLNCSGNTF